MTAMSDALMAAGASVPTLEMRSRPHPLLIPADWSDDEVAEEHESRVLTVTDITSQLAELVEDGTPERHDWRNRAGKARAYMRAEIAALRAEMDRRGIAWTVPLTEAQQRQQRLRQEADERKIAAHERQQATLRAIKETKEAVKSPEQVIAEQTEADARRAHSFAMAEQKAERMRLHAERDMQRDRRFIALVKAELTRETWLRLWAQVNEVSEPDGSEHG